MRAERRIPAILRAPARLRVGVFFVVLSLAAWAPPGRASAQEASAPVTEEGFALVLGGGGARGLAHIGVLRALEELGIAPSFVVGSSMGAIIGAMIAAGRTSAELDSLLQDRSWLLTVLDEPPPPVEVQGGWQGSIPPHQLRLRFDRWSVSPPFGASNGQSLEALLGRMTADASFAAGGDFDRLPVPFRCVTTDLVAAEAYVPTRGSLARVARASGSLPVVFAPVEIDGRVLFDGGIVDNLPLDVARAQGFTSAVIVDVSNSFLPLEDVPDDVFGVVRRAAQISQRNENRAEATERDVLIRVDLRDFGLLSFWAAAAIVRTGYEATMARADDLRALAARTGAARTPVVAPRIGPVELEDVIVVGNRRLSGWAVRRRFDVRPGDRVELEELWTRAEALARQSLFEHAWVEVERLDDGRARVFLHVTERDRPELEIAAHYRDGEGAAALVRLRLDNRFGAGSGRTLSWRVGHQHNEVRLDTSVPIRGSRRVDFRAHGGWSHEIVEIYERSREIDAWSLRGEFVGADLLVARPSHDVAVQLGVAAATHRRSTVSGRVHGQDEWRALHVGVETWTGGGLNAWPAQGFALHAYWGVPVLGGDVDGWRIEGGFVRRHHLSRRWGLNAMGGAAWGGSGLPVELHARAGGPRSWVGRRPDEIVAPKLAWGRLGLDLFLQREWRLEAAVATGWYGRDDLGEQAPRPGLQIQTVWESAIGPVHLGWSVARDGEARLFFDVGHDF